MVHLVPGVTRLVKYLSALRRICRGSSPTGTMSGASCNLRVCWSMKVHFSWTIMYGSIGQGSRSSPCRGVRSQVLGRFIPVNPCETLSCLVERQVLHRRKRCVALDERVDAPITIPGIRTNLLIVLAWGQLQIRVGARLSHGWRLCFRSS